MSERFEHIILGHFKVPEEKIPTNPTERAKMVADLLKKHHAERLSTYVQGLMNSALATFRRNTKEGPIFKDPANRTTFLDRKTQRINDRIKRMKEKSAPSS